MTNTSPSTACVFLAGVLGIVTVTAPPCPAEPTTRPAAPVAAEPQAASRPPLAPGDVFELEWASDPQLSPDGTRVVYVRNFMDVMTDRRRSDLWLVTTDGDHRPLTGGTGGTGSHSSPRWSPKGTRLAYVAGGGDGPSQVYIRWQDTGQSAPVTRLTEGPSGLSWSPDGTRLAFSMFVPEDGEQLVDPPAKPDGAQWAEAPRVIRKLLYRADGDGFLDDGHHHLFVIPADGGTPRQLTSGPYHHRGTPAWLPDGRAVVFSANRRDDWQHDPLDTEIYELTLATGALRALTDRPGPDEHPVVSPDGRHVAYLGFDDRRQGYQLMRLHIIARDGSTGHVLNGFDRDVEAPTWMDDDTVVFRFDEHGVGQLGQLRLDGSWTRLVSGIGGTALGRPYTSGSFTAAAGALAFTSGSAGHPADVVVRTADGDTRRLTRLNDDLLGQRTLGEVHTLWWTSPVDDRQVQGWVVTPPGYDPTKSYPLVLEIHGGPFAAYGPDFAAEIQLYAAAGYVVLYANPRGSTSYGEEFGNLIHHAYPGDDYHDLMAGVDAVLSHFPIDREQLYVTGGSGGGVLTAWIVGKTDRFRAAVVAKPVINWLSFALTADAYHFFWQYWFPGLPWDHPDHYWARSPLSLVGNVTTPTMVLTGEHDWRTPISESEQFYQALQLREVDAALVRIPDASHGIARRPSQLIAKVQHVLAWFAEHAGPSGEE